VPRYHIQLLLSKGISTSNKSFLPASSRLFLSLVISHPLKSNLINNCLPTCHIYFLPLLCDAYHIFVCENYQNNTTLYLCKSNIISRALRTHDRGFTYVVFNFFLSYAYIHYLSFSFNLVDISSKHFFFSFFPLLFLFSL
jgi:hypothetical protein